MLFISWWRPKTSTIPVPEWGTLVCIRCLCKCLIQSSWTDRGPWKTRSQNLHDMELENKSVTISGLKSTATLFSCEMKAVLYTCRWVCISPHSRKVKPSFLARVSILASFVYNHNLTRQYNSLICITYRNVRYHWWKSGGVRDSFMDIWQNSIYHKYEVSVLNWSGRGRAIRDVPSWYKRLVSGSSTGIFKWL